MRLQWREERFSILWLLAEHRDYPVHAQLVALAPVEADIESLQPRDKEQLQQLLNGVLGKHSGLLLSAALVNSYSPQQQYCGPWQLAQDMLKSDAGFVDLRRLAHHHYGEEIRSVSAGQ